MSILKCFFLEVLPILTMLGPPLVATTTIAAISSRCLHISFSHQNGLSASGMLNCSTLLINQNPGHDQFYILDTIFDTMNIPRMLGSNSLGLCQLGTEYRRSCMAKFTVIIYTGISQAAIYISGSLNPICILYRQCLH